MESIIFAAVDPFTAATKALVVPAEARTIQRCRKNVRIAYPRTMEGHIQVAAKAWNSGIVQPAPYNASAMIKRIVVNFMFSRM